MSHNRGLVRVHAGNGPWPLHDAAASKGIELAALADHAPQALMARAGLAVARLALAMVPYARRILVLAGPGNNGGDGIVAGTHLHRAGLDVGVTLLADPSRLPPDAAHAHREALRAGLAIQASAGAAAAPDLVIDALLGIGSKRPPQGPLAEAIAWTNRSGVPVLAVDIPSGLHPDTGALLGPEAVRADATLALLTIKPGCFTGQGRDHAGEVWFDALGVTATGATASTSAPVVWQARRHASHKGSHGDVVVVGGAPGMTGAAWLAARAALAAGAGRVYCSLLDESAPLLDPASPELMGRTRWWASPPPRLAASTVVCGCGGGEAVREALPPLLAHAGRLLLDADALNAIAADEPLMALLHQRARRAGATLLTPHPLEAARLLKTDVGTVQADRLAAARRLADLTAATVLLKGSGSVIAAPGQLPVINPTGNAALAGAGTGDVLAGWAAGLWAQQPQAPARELAARAAWSHGQAADRHPAAVRGAPLRAGDLIAQLAQR